MSLSAGIDRFQRRHPLSGYPLAVAYKFFDDQGGYLAALLAYYGFISLFPLLLLLTTVLEFVLRDNPELRERIVDSAMSQIPVIGSELGQPGQLSGGTVAVTIGVVGALYGGLGVAVAIQNAMNVVWAVPRNDRPDPIRVRLRGMLLLSTVGTAIIGLTVVNGAIAAVDLGTTGKWLSIAGSLVLTAVLFVVAFRIGTVRELGVRDVLPGAIAAAIG
ncbi:MAG TPA: ribonuclease BN, partial [Gordonia polyisoprenivorans]|nr:ribonuclease BN [Gordonia polyisoprenivorans]